MRKRITLLVAALMLALSMAFGGMAAFADPDCAPPTKPACHDSGKPGPSNFVGPGGGARQANH
jgi:Spy/CpxP family protein refolding chaperone